MVRDLEARGIESRRVLEAMGKIPREAFVEEALRAKAYEDAALPIGERQTISQPYMVALMSEALDLHGEAPRVLEVGTGSGYQAAVLATMGASVLTIERIPALASRARAVLADLELDERVRVLDGDGTLGWPDEAPYDGIVITAGAPQIPRPLLAQLALGGSLVLPMGEQDVQTLVRLRRGPQGLVEDYLGECRFVKLRGAYGWSEP